MSYTALCYLRRRNKTEYICIILIREIGSKVNHVSQSIHIRCQGQRVYLVDTAIYWVNLIYHCNYLTTFKNNHLITIKNKLYVHLKIADLDFFMIVKESIVWAVSASVLSNTIISLSYWLPFYLIPMTLIGTWSNTWKSEQRNLSALSEGWQLHLGLSRNLFNLIAN